MQKDIVIVPTFDRPEFLWLCLEYLAACPDHQSVDVRVVVDAHIGQVTPKAEIQAVLEKFPELSVSVKYRHPHQFHGNSYNLMMAYKDAYETPAEYVFLVEDDVLIHPEFFVWHRHQQSGREIGCSIGVKKESQHDVYASMGVCFRRERLQLILPHCRTAYFQDMRKYCRAHFPPSKVDCEQDGLFCRVLAGRHIVWATETPVAQHVGWYGYHRKKSIRPHGTLEERFQQVKGVLASTEILSHWVKDFEDIKPLRRVW